MTATLTITLSDDVLSALKAAKSITLELNSGGSGSHASRAAGKGARASNGKAEPYRAGSLPARLMAWAGGRKRPFGVAEVMKTLEIKRAHASMVLSRVANSGDLKRVGRGEYVAA